jgi:hypothetical protein
MVLSRCAVTFLIVEMIQIWILPAEQLDSPVKLPSGSLDPFGKDSAAESADKDDERMDFYVLYKN